MKKFFALAMATAMIASMAATAFAYDYPASKGTATKADGFSIYEKDGTKHYPVVNAVGPFSYDNDDKALTDETVEYGETAYFALLQSNDLDDPDDLSLVTKSDSVNGLKIKAKWEEGDKLVKKVEIVKKKLTNPADASDSGDYKGLAHADLLGESYGYSVNDYCYFLAISFESSTTTSDTDVIGTLTLNKSKAPKVDDLVLDIAVTVDWANSYRTAGAELVVDDSFSKILETETYYALKFEADDEVEIEFGDGSVFNVDVSGQSKLLIYFDTKYNSKIAAKYPLAELNFWNGNGAKFNRVGEMFIPVKEDYAQFLYQLNADGTLSEVAGAEYDDADEGFYFYTRVLGTYVISDMELDIKPTVTPPTTSEPPVVTPPVTNPSTGAAA